MSNTELKTTNALAAKIDPVQATATATEKSPQLAAQTPPASPAPAKAAVKKVVRTPAKKAVAAKQAVVKPVATPAPARAPLVPAKAASKTVKTSPVKAASPVVEKTTKLKKPKLVRDSFTIPKAEYLVLDELKQRSIKLANPAKKSELLRAGIKALAAMSDNAFAAAMKAVPTIKTGRPAKP